MNSSPTRVSSVLQSTVRILFGAGQLTGAEDSGSNKNAQDERLSIERRDLADAPVTILRLRGDLDARTYRKLVDAVWAVFAQGRHGLIVDLGELTGIGIAGMFALHNAARIFGDLDVSEPDLGWHALHWAGEGSTSPGRARKVRLVHPTPGVAKVLHGSPLPVDRDISSALHALHSRA